VPPLQTCQPINVGHRFCYPEEQFDSNHDGVVKYKGPNQIEFGAMSITRTKCRPNSLHDRIVKEGAAVRDYMIKGGHLFLSLMEDGAAYELEPLARSRSAVRKR